MTRALILADGAATTRVLLDAAWPGWADGLGLVIAADGGARLAAPLGVTIDRWVGDGDSVDPALLEALARAGVGIERVPTEKDESDTELAITRALESGATDITVVGALGGPRLDHELANIALLGLAGLAGTRARLLAPSARVSLIRAPGADGKPVVTHLHGRAGDLVSLLTLGQDALGVTTDQLAYQLRDEPLPAGPARGLSNVRLAEVATVTVRSGRLLVVETPTPPAARGLPAAPATFHA